MIVGGRRSGLDDEDVATAYILHDLNIDFAVAEAADGGAAQRHVQMPRDILRELGIGVPREEGHCIGRRHSSSSSNPGWGGIRVSPTAKSPKRRQIIHD